MYSLPQNLTIIESTDKDQVTKAIKALRSNFLHATNGAYDVPIDVMFGTTLSGFMYVNDHVANLTDAFLIAVNSDQSLRNDGKEPQRDQLQRALQAALPIAHTAPSHEVVIAFYDEATPTELYNRLAQPEEFQLSTLHKWGGYGIGKDAPVIEGAESFKKTMAFPFFNADKPAFWSSTQTGDQSDIVEVVDLHRTTKNMGQAYLDENNNPLFITKNIADELKKLAIQPY